MNGLNEWICWKWKHQKQATATESESIADGNFMFSTYMCKYSEWNFIADR